MSNAAAQANGPMFQRSAQLRAFARMMGDDMSTSTAGYSSPGLTVGGPAGEEGEILEWGF